MSGSIPSILKHSNSENFLSKHSLLSDSWLSWESSLLVFVPLLSFPLQTYNYCCISCFLVDLICHLFSGIKVFNFVMTNLSVMSSFVPPNSSPVTSPLYAPLLPSLTLTLVRFMPSIPSPLMFLSQLHLWLLHYECWFHSCSQFYHHQLLHFMLNHWLLYCWNWLVCAFGYATLDFSIEWSSFNFPFGCLTNFSITCSTNLIDFSTFWKNVPSILSLVNWIEDFGDVFEDGPDLPQAKIWTPSGLCT